MMSVREDASDDAVKIGHALTIAMDAAVRLSHIQDLQGVPIELVLTHTV